jgi:hypothetical protein
MFYLNFATGINVPPYWLNRAVQVLPQNADGFRLPERYLGNLYQCPLRIKWEDEQEWWTLPFDPVVSVSGKNIIVRRNVLKQDNLTSSRRGSVKEAWSQDDYNINIAGVFIGENGEFPNDDIMKLRRYCEARKVVEVESDLFCLFNITKMAIESYDLPFTKGVENQMYTLKGYSDDSFELLVREEGR